VYLLCQFTISWYQKFSKVIVLVFLLCQLTIS
jgi:hypothetical protein